MPEIAVNAPLDASEIVEIALQEFKKRLLGLSPLQSNKEFASFSLQFDVKIRLRRAGEEPNEAKETLAWGTVTRNDDGGTIPLEQVVTAEDSSHFESKDPNEERVSRDMPLLVETGDGRGGKLRKKVRIK